MQKLLRRTALARGQAKRKTQAKNDLEFQTQRNTYQKNRSRVNRERTEAIREERHRRTLDYQMGPLSPWRNNLNAMAQDQDFGTWSAAQYQLPDKPERDRVKDWMIREGDRVVVIEGHESVKGRIGKVKKTNKESEAVTIEGVNSNEIVMPSAMEAKEPTQRADVPIPLRSVRLIYPLPDPSTGIPRDVIINNLAVRERRFDVYENEETFERWLEPQHIRIPWPEKKEPNLADEKMDTLRVQTEVQSFLPTLLIPPMPVSVIDEMRNKYGVFRDRHDDDFVAKKTAEDKAAEIEERRRQALRPRGAYNVARRRGSAPRAGGRAVLPDELAARIGEHMASNRPLVPS